MFILIVGCGRVGSSVARGDAAARATRSPASTRTPSPTRGSRSASTRAGRTSAASSRSAPALETDALRRRRDRAGRRLHRLDRRRQHEHRHRPDRPAPLRGADRDRADPRPAAGRVVRSSRACTRSARPGSRSTCSRARVREGAGGGEVAVSAMYIIVVGAGKVGWNLARELLEKDHEVTVIESNRRRYLTVEQELEHNVPYGDASELWVLERAGIQRADMVIAVTGDDEDNMLICQVAREKYDGRADHRPGQQPAQPPALRPARGQALGLRHRPDPAPARARGARVRARPPARPAGGAAGDHRDAARQGLAGHRAAGRRPLDARRQPADLGAARRQGLRARRRHRARGRRRGPRRARPGPRGRPQGALRAGRRRQRGPAERWPTARSTSC